VCFAGFVIVIRLRHGAVSSCGCFGTPDTPATWLHAAINAFLAASAAVIALNEPGGNIVTVLRSQPGDGIPLLLAVGIGMWLVVLAFSRLAQLTAVRRTLVGRVEGSST
jgi:tellurite resistance protein TehA-like permease